MKRQKMNLDNMTVRELSNANAESIQSLFAGVFTREPWNDDWSDTNQLHAYLLDLCGNPNSLSLGLFEGDELVGISLGWVIHWFSGTEYYVREFCVSTDLQHRGYGSFFLEKMQQYLPGKSITAIVLSTDRDTSAYRFYLKNGFSEIEKSVFFYKNLPRPEKE